MLRRKRADININHERWLVSYADFVTLLFAFFVVMYSVSQVNEKKLEALSSTLENVFAVQAIPTEATTLVTDNNSEKSEVVSEGDQKTTFTFTDLAKQLSESLGDLVDHEAVDIANNESWLQITLNNRVLFPVGSVTPSEQARNILEDVAAVLKDLDNPVQVEGFTDNVAINTSQFPSNWELSSARASSIVKVLMGYGVSPHQLSAVGYGEFQPIANNHTEAGRAKNRRVVLMVGKHPRVRPKNISEPEASNNGTPETPPILQPTILNNGEHLFSSDPDLPRN